MADKKSNRNWDSTQPIMAEDLPDFIRATREEALRKFLGRRLAGENATRSFVPSADSDSGEPGSGGYLRKIDESLARLMREDLERTRNAAWDQKAHEALMFWHKKMPDSEYARLVSAAAKRRSGAGLSAPAGHAYVQGVARPIMPPPKADELPLRRTGSPPVRTETEESIYRTLLARNPRGAMIRAMTSGGLSSGNNAVFQQILDSALDTPPEVLAERVRASAGRDIADMNNEAAVARQFLQELANERLAQIHADIEGRRISSSADIESKRIASNEGLEDKRAALSERLANLQAGVDREKIAATLLQASLAQDEARRAKATEMMLAIAPQRAAALIAAGVSPSTAWRQAADEARGFVANLVEAGTDKAGGDGGASTSNVNASVNQAQARGLPPALVTYLQEKPEEREDLMSVLDQYAYTFRDLARTEPEVVRNFLRNFPDDEVVAALYEPAHSTTGEDSYRRAAARQLTGLMLGYPTPGTLNNITVDDQGNVRGITTDSDFGTVLLGLPTLLGYPMYRAYKRYHTHKELQRQLLDALRQGTKFPSLPPNLAPQVSSLSRP